MPTEIYLGEPWYLKRQPPVFCDPCAGIYNAIYPARKPVLVIAVILWILGVIMVISLIVACVSTECGTIAAVLVPISLLVLWVGYLLFHCAWAAHLLEDDLYPADRTAPTKEQTDSSPFQVAYDETGKPINEPRVGFWQFAEDEAWQAVSSRDTLQ